MKILARTWFLRYVFQDQVRQADLRVVEVAAWVQVGGATRLRQERPMLTLNMAKGAQMTGNSRRK